MLGAPAPRVLLRTGSERCTFEPASICSDVGRGDTLPNRLRRVPRGACRVRCCNLAANIARTDDVVLTSSLAPLINNDKPFQRRVAGTMLTRCYAFNRAAARAATNSVCASLQVSQHGNRDVERA